MEPELVIEDDCIVLTSAGNEQWLRSEHSVVLADWR